MDTRLTLEMQDDPVDGIRNIPTSPDYPSIPTTVAQINRLPPEMLVAIFAHLSKLKRDSISHFVRDLVSVTHVCVSWRQVAINAPELWTEITMMGPEMVKVFLERSRAVPLNVDLRLGSELKINTDILEAVIPHTHRFRQLTVFAGPGSGLNASTHLTKPAPLLERLEIYYPPGVQQILLFDDQTPRLRELVMGFEGLWLQTQLGNLTSLHLALSHTPRGHSDFLPFFDTLRRCPVLEEMFLLWDGWGLSLPPQPPTVTLHRLRKLLLHSIRTDNLKYFLHAFDLRTDGIAIHLSGMSPPYGRNDSIYGIQGVFPNDNSGRPSLVSSTKLELIFHARPRTIIMHAVGPGFSIRIDLHPSNFIPDDVNCVLRDGFPSVKEFWVRGSSHFCAKLGGVEHLTALEKLVVVGRGSKLARNFRQALSPDPLGVVPCPLLSTIDCLGDISEMREIFLLLRTRSNAGHPLEELRIPSSFIPLPADITSCVRDVRSLDIPSRILHLYVMDLPKFCFSEREHEWWKLWKSRLN